MCQRNEAFQIKMEAVDKSDKTTTYGVVLYLNGQRVHGKKTMRRFGWFQGFKKGNGMFSQFLFSTPDIFNGETNEDGGYHDADGNRL